MKMSWLIVWVVETKTNLADDEDEWLGRNCDDGFEFDCPFDEMNDDDENELITLEDCDPLNIESELEFDIEIDVTI